MDAAVIWKNDLSFDGIGESGFSLPLGTDISVGGANDGFRPMELMLIGMAGCTAMDVISILRKKKQIIKAFEVKVNADRSEEHPKVFSEIHIEYHVAGDEINPEAVERAVELSETKYCSGIAMLSKTAKITHRIVIK